MMRVNRVFCYSKDIAKQNGNKLPILELVLTTILFIVAAIALPFILGDPMALMPLFVIEIFAFMGLITYFSIILGLRLRARITGWATTDDNRIFKAMTMNNGQGLYFGGLAAGSLVDQLSNSAKDIGRNIGGAVGAAGQFYAMNQQAQYMSHPEIVAKMVEEAPNITGAEVIEILKVHSITDGKHSVKINCDYKTLRTDKVKYNKNVSIEKSYNQFNDLINAINTHR